MSQGNLSQVQKHYTFNATYSMSVFKKVYLTVWQTWKFPYATPGRVCLQEPALHLCVSVYTSFCAAPDPFSICLEEHVQYLYTSICTAPCQVCLQEPVLHLHVSVYKSLCCTCTCLPTRACAAPARVCLQELVLHLHVSVYKSLCCTCTCLSTRACAALTRVCL